MKLTSGKPYWPQKDRDTSHFPQPTRDVETEILVVGGGITGALVALAFAEAGCRVVAADRRKICHGSTSASTALLQYEIDEDLIDLTEKIGRKKAERAYHLCGEAIDKVGAISREHGGDFSRGPSFYLAGRRRDVKTLRKECEARSRAGFEVEWLSRRDLRERYGIEAYGAIRSELGGAVDPYKLAFHIFSRLQDEGHGIYELTELDVEKSDGGRANIRTRTGQTIRAEKVVFAAGYESQNYLQERVVELKSTYALTTRPLDQAKVWPEQVLLWDSLDPYLYARLTADRRIMMGGADIPFKSSYKREDAHKKRIAKVVRQFRRYLPDLDFTVETTWNGMFGETQDGLAYIGETPEWNDCYFALGFGGNGITYSALAGELLVKLYRGEAPEDLDLFRFGR